MRKYFHTRAGLITLILGIIILIPSLSMGGDKKKIGIRAGYHNAAMQSIDSSWNNNLNIFYVGAFKDVKFFPFLYASSGLEYFINGNQKNSDNKLLLHYLSVPLDIKLKAGPLYAMGGVTFNFKIGEKYMANGVKADLPVNGKIKTFDSSAFIGVGIKILMIGIEGQYHWGLVDVYNGFHNNYYQVGLALFF